MNTLLNKKTIKKTIKQTNIIFFLHNCKFLTLFMVLFWGANVGLGQSITAGAISVVGGDSKFCLGEKIQFEIANTSSSGFCDPPSSYTYSWSYTWAGNSGNSVSLGNNQKSDEITYNNPFVERACTVTCSISSVGGTKQKTPTTKAACVETDNVASLNTSNTFNN